MSDAELIAGFEDGTLPPASFGHREHVQLAWAYLQRHGRGEAERRLLTGLRAFAARAGKPDKFDAGLTSRWVALIADAAAGIDAREGFEGLVRRRPALLDPAAARAGLTL